MNLLNAQQIKEWDQYTIEQEPISSINLMERAATACVEWIKEQCRENSFYVFCGTGNNGGDGLAMARQMLKDKLNVKVFILAGASYTDDFTLNLERLKEWAVPSFLETDADFPELPAEALLIDALFGTGLNRPLEGLPKRLVKYLNAASNTIVAIDIPSGLFCDKSSIGVEAIKATHTLSFQRLKMAFLVAENEMNTGAVHVLDIGLNEHFPEKVHSPFKLTDHNLASSLYQPRKAFSHKGSFGHALLCTGSYGKTGAAVLCTKACLRSGAGLTTVHLPEKSLEIMQISAPEAMCRADEHPTMLTKLQENPALYSSVGVGPGIGTAPATSAFLQDLLQTYAKPMVIDADALNIIAKNKSWIRLLPANSILTPHPKEFARLFGDTNSDFDRINRALQKAAEWKLIIVLKGRYTVIALPNGQAYFNTSGNAGMATGGSGDVLTGLLTGLLAQGYKPEQAAILGVYMHGRAGDQAAAKYGMEALIAGDLIEELKYIRFNR